MQNKLKPLTDTTIIYARPSGWHYHLDKNCPMLQGDLGRLGYIIIPAKDIERRNLSPCLCAYVDKLL